jgi:hypothetical protein
VTDRLAAADVRCTCGQTPHLQTCRVERERSELGAAMLRAAIERMEDRARGFRLFPHAPIALRWYFSKVRRWSSPRGVDLDAANGGAPSRARPEDPRRVFASIAYAIGKAEEDAKARGAGPVGEWMRQAYAGGRSYDFIAEGAGVPAEAVRRAMSRAHRVIRVRLEAAGVIEGGESVEGG